MSDADAARAAAAAVKKSSKSSATKKTQHTHTSASASSSTTASNATSATVVNPNNVLSVCMRPKCFGQLVGQGDIVSVLQSQFNSERIPHFFILSGPIGSGKTTIARLIAMTLQIWNKNEKTKIDIGDLQLPWDMYNKYDIREINAANKNGVDDIRELIETMRYLPIFPSKAKVVIMDEAHQITNAAQNALLTEVEDAKKHVYYIFCTSQISKLLPSLRRRAFVVTPSLLDDKAVCSLVRRAARVAWGGVAPPHCEKAEDEESSAGPSDDTGGAQLSSLMEVLLMNDVRSSGLVLQAAERFFAGMSAMESVQMGINPSLDVMQFCRATAKGDWAGATEHLKLATKDDVIGIRACLLGYLKTMILSTTGPTSAVRAVCLSKAIRALSTTSVALSSNEGSSMILPDFCAAVCIACEHIKSAR